MFSILYFSISAVEAILLFVYIVSVGSSAEEVVIFNMSWARLILASAILILSCLFIFLVIYSVINRKNETSLVNRFLKNEHALWVAFFISICLVLMSFFLLSQRMDQFANFTLLFQRIKPLIAFFIVFCSQTACMIAIWYTTNFVVRNQGTPSANNEKVLVSLFGLFLFVVMVKLLFYAPYSYGPVGDMDEMDYFYLAESFFNGDYSAGFVYHYPPLYPISIMPVFVFYGYAYEGIKFLNVIFSTSIIFPIYFISRMFLDHRKSWIAAFLSCLIPFHLVFSMRIASESLFFPLFLWAMLITFVNPINDHYRFHWDILNGVFISLLYLTRFITLATIPFFIIAWWIKPLNSTGGILKLDRKKLFHFSVLLISMAVSFSPWLLFGLINRIPLKQILGFIITSKTTLEQLTFSRLLVYCFLYFCYFLIIAAPILNLLIGLFIHVDLKNLNSIFTRWVIIVSLIITGVYIAVVRHSWRALYNADDPSRIMGRYLIYFTPLFFILAFVLLMKFERSRYRSFLQFMVYHQLLPLALLTLSYLVLFMQFIIRAGGNLINLHGSVDAYLVKALGHYFFIIVFLIYLVTNLFLWSNKRKFAFTALVIGLISFYVGGTPKYFYDLIQYRTYPWLAYKISSLLPPPDQNNLIVESINIFLPNDFLERQKWEIYNGLRVRGIKTTFVDKDNYIKTKNYQSDTSFLIISANQNDFSNDTNTQIYEINGQQFKIIPVKQDNQ